MEFITTNRQKIVAASVIRLAALFIGYLRYLFVQREWYTAVAVYDDEKRQ